MSTWLDRPLSVAGRVMVGDENGIRAQLVDIDRDLLMIPNVAIHMNRKANDGFTWNPAVDTLPLMGGGDCKGAFDALLKKAAGSNILGHDLYLYIRQKATVWGLKKEFLSAAALDDLACAWCCYQGFVAAKDAASVPVLCVFDSEEVGSSSVQGAASDLLETALKRICCAMGWNLPQMLAQSFMVSADNAHAVHPNHPEKADPTNRAVLGGGVVIKHHAGKAYTTDSVSSAIMQTVCARAGVQYQNFFNRSDVRSGSTLGVISQSRISMPAVDVGIAQLAMHSANECFALEDYDAMQTALTAFYSSTITVDGDQVTIE
jgi:aspartyl aminopeptidase